MFKLLEMSRSCFCYFIFEFCIRITPRAPGSLAVREDFVIASTLPTTGSYLALLCVVCVFWSEISTKRVDHKMATGTLGCRRKMLSPG